jgi:hypothetical protein
VKETPGSFALIAGHNENGKFVFLGGAREEIPILSEDCARAVKVCIFISCKSNDYVKDGAIGVSRDLTLAEGVYITTKIRRWLEEHPNVSIVQVAAFTRSVELRANLRFHVSYFAMAACAAAGTPAVAYILIEGVQAAPAPNVNREPNELGVTDSKLRDMLLKNYRLMERNMIIPQFEPKP